MTKSAIQIRCLNYEASIKIPTVIQRLVQQCERLRALVVPILIRMCKAWHQYNERLRALASLNLPQFCKRTILHVLHTKYRLVAKGHSAPLCSFWLPRKLI